MLLHEYLDVADLEQHIIDGNVEVKRHPTEPFAIFNYTRQCQFAKRWDDVTTKCRGLVVLTGADGVWSADSPILAIPFRKFFNYAEHAKELPYTGGLDALSGDFTAYDKADGSLAVVFERGGRWFVATRRSFESVQAQWAQAYLDAADTSGLVRNITYLAEIIYPGNRIVVDNGDRRDLVLLGGVHRVSGRDKPLYVLEPAWDGVGSVVRRYPRGTSLDVLTQAVQTNVDPETGRPVAATEAEGFVLRYEDGTRVKIKYAEYVALHATVTGLRNLDVWRAMAADDLFDKIESVTRLAKALSCPAEEAASFAARQGKALGLLLDALPDEMDGAVRGLQTRYTEDVTALWDRVQYAHQWYIGAESDRKAYAAYAATFEPDVRNGMFLLRDGRIPELRKHCWQAVKPPVSLPVFAVDADG